MVNKHQKTFQAHPQSFADLIFNQAVMCYKIGQSKAAAKNVAWAMKIHPIHTLARLGSPIKQNLFRVTRNSRRINAIDN